MGPTLYNYLELGNLKKITHMYPNINANVFLLLPVSRTSTLPDSDSDQVSEKNISAHSNKSYMRIGSRMWYELTGLV